MSERAIEIFLQLLNCFLNQTEPEIDSDLQEKMTGDEWRQLFEMAAQHQVIAMIYDKLGRTEAIRCMQPELKETFRKAAFQSIYGQTRQTQLFHFYYRQLNDLGITPLIVKGIICRNIYPQPDYRPSGDEDMLISSADFKAVDEFFTAHGFVRDKEVEDAKVPEEMGYRNLSNGAYYEIHTRLFSESSDAYGYFNQMFGDAFERQIVINIDGTECHTLDYTQHLCYLCCHSMKHFLHGGVGIRQLCDIMMFIRAYGGSIDWPAFWEQAGKLRIACYCANLLDIGERYLGFSYEAAGALRADIMPDSEDLLMDILDSGIYGKSSAARVHSANITLQAAGAEKGNGHTAGGIWRSLFPSYDYMAGRFPYVKKHRFMIIWAYIQRIWHYEKERRSLEEEKTSTQIGRERVELLKKYDIVD